MAPLLHTLRRAAGASVVDGFFRAASRAGSLHPKADPAAHGVTVTRDVRYRDPGGAEHLVDVWRPPGDGPFPTMLYLHGGGFRILSKETHWVMALAYARRGWLVVNASYRLAPKHPFPAAIDDACAAYVWTVRNAARFGGDPAHISVAGESAGANLAASVALAACFERDEPYAREVFATGAVPRAVVASCGIFQVTDTERYRRERKLPWYIADRLDEVSSAYLGASAAANFDLADPLCLLERGDRPARALPPFFLPVGTADPLLHDTRRMASALAAHGAIADARYYAGGIHAFHAFVWTRLARRCWDDTWQFLAESGALSA